MTVGVPNTGMKSCLIKNVSEEKIKQLIRHNIVSLQNIINYNNSYAIRLFRISSDVIPFGASQANTMQWTDLFRQELLELGGSIKSAGIRVSMHPGQYTVLNSPDRQVAKYAIQDLAYHCTFLDSLEVDSTNKIILHIGGVYGDKEAAMLRFTERFRALAESIKHRLAIENDDRFYNIDDVMELGARLGLPVVYDTLHNEVNCCDICAIIYTGYISLSFHQPLTGHISIIVRLYHR